MTTIDSQLSMYLQNSAPKKCSQFSGAGAESLRTADLCGIQTVKLVSGDLRQTPEIN